VLKSDPVNTSDTGGDPWVEYFSVLPTSVRGAEKSILRGGAPRRREEENGFCAIGCLQFGIHCYYRLKCLSLFQFKWNNKCELGGANDFF
jgi:hypothetical protein